MTFEILETEKVCATCKYYHPHYAPDELRHRGWVMLNCGHCVNPRLKPRKPGNEACNYWEEDGDIAMGIN